MAAYKETPRQQMISVMYLVLTAMLALNVSKEVIDAFSVVNESIEETNKSYASKIEQAYSKFEFQYKLNPVKVEAVWQKAKIVKQLSDNMRNYLNATIDSTITLAEGKSIKEIKEYIAKSKGISPSEINEIPLSELRKKDNYDATSRYFVPNPAISTKKGKAQEVKNKFKSYRENVLKMIPEAQRMNFSIGPNFDTTYRDASGMKESWEIHNFYHTIMAADVTILNKLKVDVQNAELDVLNYLYGSISEENFKFTNVEAKVIPKSNYVLMGEEYVADVIVAAYDTTQHPDVYIQHGVDRITNIKNAKRIRNKKDIVNLAFKSDRPGEHKYAGMLSMPSPDGKIKNYYFNDSYFVGRRSATVSATKMNVLYRGVDNPVSISVPGVPTSQIRPVINTGKLVNKGNGQYIVQLPANSKNSAEIKVNAVVDGKESFFDSFKFRVRKIPDPQPTVGGTYTTGGVPKDFLKISSIIAKTPEYFDFDYTFSVVSFEMWYLGSDGYWSQLQSNSHNFTPEMKKLINKLPINSRVQFEKIKVKAPEGIRELKNSISIKIK